MKKKSTFMDLQKKLIAAILMLTISFSLLVGSTFAWYTMSTAPEVTGINTSMGANGALEIALLTADTFEDTDAISSAAGSSSEAQSTYIANTTWGNIVDLSYIGYGLHAIDLKPAELDTDGTEIGSNILNLVEIGEDGRISATNSDAMMTAVYNKTDKKFNDAGKGVRAIGSWYTSSDAIDDTYGYIVDLAFKTNVDDSHLLLQTDAADRVYSGGNGGTQGNGSYFEFDTTDLSEDKLWELIQAITVVFAEPTDSGYTLLATAKLDADGRISDTDDTSSVTTINVPLKIDTTDGKTITELEKNTVKKVCVIVYLDGEKVHNSSFAWMSNKSATGTLNLQFASDVELIPADNTDLETREASETIDVDDAESLISKIETCRSGEILNLTSPITGGCTITLDESIDKTIVIKGESIDTLTINAPGATFSIYNNIENLNIEAVAGDSIHIYSTVNELIVSSGHVVIEPGALIEEFEVDNSTAVSVTNNGTVHKVDATEKLKKLIQDGFSDGTIVFKQGYGSSVGEIVQEIKISDVDVVEGKANSAGTAIWRYWTGNDILEITGTGKVNTLSHDVYSGEQLYIELCKRKSYTLLIDKSLEGIGFPSSILFALVTNNLTGIRYDGTFSELAEKWNDSDLKTKVDDEYSRELLSKIKAYCTDGEHIGTDLLDYLRDLQE